MSLIKSLHVNFNETHLVDDHLSQKQIKAIAMSIVEKHASLIVDIEKGHANHQLLRKEIVSYLDESIQFNMNRDKTIEAVMNYMFGYGVIQAYIDDEDVTDIDICRFDFMIIKKHGQKLIVSSGFEDEDMLLNYCKLIVIRLGGVINENDCHCRVSDHKKRLRINVTIGPRNTTGASMTIRKHRISGYTLDDLQELDMMSLDMKKCLKQLMKVSSRIVIVGKGAAGKTTLLRALLKEVPLTERFLICETETELYPDHANFIVQKVQNKKKKTTLNDLIKDGLTMSLDGYCIGELVQDEVLEFLKAGYTDHRILGTLHAAGINATLPRMLSMIKHKDIGVNNNFVAGALDIIIYVRQFKIFEITELTVEDDIHYNTLFKFTLDREYKHKTLGRFNQLNTVKFRLKEEMKRLSYD